MLVLVVAILGAVLVTLVGLAALMRVESSSVGTSNVTAEANQNALFALRLALGQLQRFTGDEGVVTARAEAIDSTSSNPNWCGVWRADTGGPLVWLVSGNELNPLTYEPQTALPLAIDGSVAIMQRVATWKHAVRVPKIDIRGRKEGVRDEVVTGRYAYWVSDESTKVSVNVNTGATLPTGIAKYPKLNAKVINSALDVSETDRDRLLVTDQLLDLGLAPATLNSVWNDITVSTQRLYVDAGSPMLTEAPFNVNSVSDNAWKAVLAAEDLGISEDDRAKIVEGIQKAGRPIRALDDFKAALQTVLTSAGSLVTAAAVTEQLEPLLTVRGDSFLLRGYGEVVDPLSGSGEVVARAACEARVQRIPQELIGTAGWKYVITYFRWLNPADL